MTEIKEEFQDIDKTLAFIRDHAPKLAQAKADRIQLGNMLKVVFSDLYLMAPGKTIDDKKAWAYRHADYIKAINGHAAAAGQEEKLRWQMTSAELRVEVWRSEQANARFIDRSHQ